MRIQKQKNKNYKEYIVDMLHLPRDVCLGEMEIMISGNSQVMIQNYRGILAYDDHCIRIQGLDGRVTVEGKNLLVNYYTNEDMKIEGDIYSIHFS